MSLYASSSCSTQSSCIFFYRGFLISIQLLFRQA